MEDTTKDIIRSNDYIIRLVKQNLQCQVIQGEPIVFQYSLVNFIVAKFTSQLCCFQVFQVGFSQLLTSRHCQAFISQVYGFQTLTG